MEVNSVLLIVIVILILIDVFLAYEFPTHLAYILLTFVIVKEIHNNLIYQSLIGLLVWFALAVFHYTVWRKIIERIHDKIISPRKHTGGIEGLIGKKGLIKEIEGVKFISINEELYEFESEKMNEIITGNTYDIVNVKSNKLLI